jgi:hypothetical protein
MRTASNPLTFLRHSATPLLAATATIITHASPSVAQSTEPRPDRLGPATAAGEPRIMGGLGFAVGHPRGAFRRYVTRGLGVEGHALYRVDRQGILALRLDGGVLNYGRETLRMPLGTPPGGGRVQLDVTTTNNIGWLGVGPALMLPRGPVRPYANANAGVTYFATTSSARGSDFGNVRFAQSTNHDDLQFAWGGGAGVLVPVYRAARTLLALDVGAQYRDNGRNVRYVTEGGIRDLPNGNVQVGVVRSRADLLTWHVGLSIGAR